MESTLLVAASTAAWQDWPNKAVSEDRETTVLEKVKIQKVQVYVHVQYDYTCNV